MERRDEGGKKGERVRGNGENRGKRKGWGKEGREIGKIERERDEKEECGRRKEEIEGERGKKERRWESREKEREI